MMPRAVMLRALMLLAVLAGACAHRTPVGELRFHNQAPVWRVDDRPPLAAPPATRISTRSLYHADGFLVRRATRAMEVRAAVGAQDVNSLGEVPDSTWFTNRIGVRDLSLEELRAGPNVSPSPFDHLPWKITGAKIGGLSIGFVFEDARGGRHILKFDQADTPEMETGAHAIVHRILWAIGYNVPEDHVGHVHRRDLQIAPGATTKRPTGAKVPLTEAELDAALARVAREADGRIRVLASRFLPGKPIGPYAREGTRADDPNDVIPHERRRSLRGQYAIFAWLNHTDLQEDNTLDVFTGDHVVHYLIDFGKALGVMGHHLKWRTVGYTHRIDVGMAARSLVSFGLWKRPWEGIERPALRGVGLLEAAHYDPGAWRPNSLYWPLEDKDRFDAFWGAKLLMRFSPAQLAAIVGEARFTDPRASRYMLEALIARQRKTARYWFDRVAPLDAFAAEAGPGGAARVCFTDLTLAYALDAAATRYAVDAYDRAGGG
ncbi:MAG TPA: hypothetical protein VK932_14935, partial [Kofleriaceae bacterium]|nr:hypothetical protein [Kofleriaceae bacterium]